MYCVIAGFAVPLMVFCGWNIFLTYNQISIERTVNENNAAASGKLKNDINKTFLELLEGL